MGINQSLGGKPAPALMFMTGLHLWPSPESHPHYAVHLSLCLFWGPVVKQSSTPVPQTPSTLSPA